MARTRVTRALRLVKHGRVEAFSNAETRGPTYIVRMTRKSIITLFDDKANQSIGFSQRYVTFGLPRSACDAMRPCGRQ